MFCLLVIGTWATNDETYADCVYNYNIASSNTCGTAATHIYIYIYI